MSLLFTLIICQDKTQDKYFTILTHILFTFLLTILFQAKKLMIYSHRIVLYSLKLKIICLYHLHKATTIFKQTDINLNCISHPNQLSKTLQFKILFKILKCVMIFSSLSFHVKYDNPIALLLANVYHFHSKYLQTI